MLLRACLSGRMGLEPSMADGNITVEVSTQAAQAEVERLRAENARLAREAHTWWTAARDAAATERARCALRVALHSQYPIETDFDRGYDKSRKDAAETLRTMGEAPDTERERIARWLEGQGQPGYAHEVRHGAGA